MHDRADISGTMPTMNNIDNESFGSKLREARQNAGYDIDTLARRLHIRSDIIAAIESSNFKDMPATGYSKNMIRSYARCVGLNQNEIADQYLREAKQFERSRDIGKRAEIREINSSLRSKDRQRSSARNASFGTTSRTGEEKREQRRYRSNRTAATPSQMTTKSMSSTFTLGNLPKPSVPSVDPNSIVKIAVVAIIVVLVIVIAIMLFGGNKQQAEEVPTMPISGLTDTSNQASSESQESKTVKTKATFQFSVESGSKSYCTVTLDGVSKFAEVATGPTTKTYEVTGVIVFATANPDPVTAKLDNKEVELSVDSSTGYYTYTYDFAAENAKTTTETTEEQSATSTSSTTNGAVSGTTTSN